MYVCTATAGQLSSACLTSNDVYCSGTAASPAGSGGSAQFPSYSFQTATCYPRSCDSGSQGAIEAAYKAMLCGPGRDTLEWCQFQLSCTYDTSASLLWPILGGVVGLLVLACCCFFAWVKWEQRKQRLRELRAADPDRRGSQDGAALEGDTNELLMNYDGDRL